MKSILFERSMKTKVEVIASSVVSIAVFLIVTVQTFFFKKKKVGEGKDQ